jgi:hypothetical protein
MSLARALSALLIVGLIACAPRGPVIDTGSKPAGVGGTISGRATFAGDSTPLAGRKVTAVSLADGQRFDTTTAANGGYTIKVPIGRYRLELELRARETLVEQPGETEIRTSDLDTSRNFVVSVK